MHEQYECGIQSKRGLVYKTPMTSKALSSSEMNFMTCKAWTRMLANVGLIYKRPFWKVNAYAIWHGFWMLSGICTTSAYTEDSRYPDSMVILLSVPKLLLQVTSHQSIQPSKKMTIKWKFKKELP